MALGPLQVCLLLGCVFPWAAPLQPVECSFLRVSCCMLVLQHKGSSPTPCLTELCCCPAEVDFWRQRNTALSSLYEQLNLPAVKTYMSVLEVGSSDQNLLASFKTHFAELKKVCLHAERPEAVLLLPIPAAGHNSPAYYCAPVGTSRLRCCAGSLS